MQTSVHMDTSIQPYTWTPPFTVHVCVTTILVASHSHIHTPICISQEECDIDTSYLITHHCYFSVLDLSTHILHTPHFCLLNIGTRCYSHYLVENISCNFCVVD
ncbi:hypothetical protein BRARA_F01025 [Brassica rapa]|uniref:Uncharacterized protein n=1 Tax=Brassica campestris TaxID=3711 RepID=A0A397Z0K9_BRACM|nr:hypothetical protein BRARA_F01025 [Brassica rapa]